LSKQPAKKEAQADQPLPPIEEVAVAITEMAKAMRRLNSSRLKRDAIVTLIQHRSKVARKTIEIVLNNLEDMDKDYLKPLGSLAEKK
jgi:hypothetical protein